MPPKKKEVVVEKALLGRFRRTLKCGIVGMPNVGKSTFFNVLCKQQAEASNFAFCTIKPNESQTIVPDDRFDYLCEKFKPKSEVPAVLKVTDIAGLVRGASEGQGLGNEFLSNISAVDGIFHMVRAFSDEEVLHVENTVDPVRDMEIISNELRLKDIKTIEARLEGVSESRLVQDKQLKAVNDMEKKFLAHLQQGLDIRSGDWNHKEVDLLNEILFLTAKPMIVLVNLSEKDYVRRKNKWLGKIKAWVDAHGADPIIPISCAYEMDLAQLESDEARATAEETAGAKSALAKVGTAGYRRLNLIHFFTVGPDEVKCWTIRKGMKAPQAAGTIHGDFEDGFICADVYNFDVLKEKNGDEAEVRKAGKLKNEGKNYVVKDGDIMLFKFNASNAKKKGKK